MPISGMRAAGTYGRALGMIAGLLAFAVAAVAQPLNGDLRTLYDKAKLGAAKVGISIVDAQTGSVIGQLRANAPAGTGFSPASNMKILTSGAALLVLGKDFEFRTRLYRAGTKLVIEGSGDPGLADPKLLEKMQLGLDAFADRLAEAVAGAMPDGASPLTEVIVDDRVFDRELVRPEWPRDQKLEWYCAEVSGLNFHTNVLRVYAALAEQDGAAPRIRWEPATAGIDILNHARSSRRVDTSTIGFTRDGDNNTFTIKGTLKASLVVPESVNLHDSGLALARMVAERLTRSRKLLPAAAPVRPVGPDEPLGQPDQVFIVIRTPMETVLERCNADSHNLYAECLLKRLGNAVTGQPGSWTNGAAVIRMQVRDHVGPEAAAILQVLDGSGLARGNSVTPEMLTAWLADLSRNDSVADAFIDSLPLAGKEGTMAKRFRDKKLGNEVRGKSGLIDGVRCLSGYVTHRPTGRRIAYSILVNDIPSSVPGAKVKDFHEDVVAAVDKWLTSQSRATTEAIGG